MSVVRWLHNEVKVDTEAVEDVSGCNAFLLACQAGQMPVVQYLAEQVPPVVLPTISFTPSALTALCRAERAEVPIQRLVDEAMWGVPAARDRGTSAGLRDTITFVESDGPGAGADLTTYSKQDALGGGCFAAGLRRCLGGPEGETRIWGVRTYGVALQEVVAYRRDLVERGDALSAQPGRFVRRATVEAGDCPAWCLYAAHFSKNTQYLCTPCRGEVRKVLVGWFCEGC